MKELNSEKLQNDPRVQQAKDLIQQAVALGMLIYTDEYNIY